MSLDDLRKRIDALDGDLVRLLNERTQVVLEIGKLKESSGEEVYAPAREKVVMDRVGSLNKGPLPKESLQAIYREVMSASLALERGVVIAYLGPKATFTHQAARSKFGGSVKYADSETISDVFAAVEKRAADYGVVPIENSTDGAVTHTLDQFIETPLKICAEIYLPISHSLLSTSPRDQIRKLYSKLEVFGQCRRWLHENMPGVELISASSTARAAEMAAKEPNAGALASGLAGELYGLTMLDHDVQDLGGNTTRFLVIGKAYGKPTGSDRTSVLFAVKHKVGALHDALSAFKRNSINMTKIESRPSKTKAWEYYFFVDVEGHAGDPPVQKALDELSEHCTLMTVLGSYPKASEREQ
ncbi:MAG TPA: prephenate dehydratase [Kiritimatiellia bacterium]|nr:prephenate dehydratase [Kiritimatiellia bacterium]